MDAVGEPLHLINHSLSLTTLLLLLVLLLQQYVTRTCRIQRYSVIPLSTNSGLIGWVPNCDTLHSLIRDYREKKKILLNLEHRIMLRVRVFHFWLIMLQIFKCHFVLLAVTNSLCKDPSYNFRIIVRHSDTLSRWQMLIDGFAYCMQSIRCGRII